MNINLKPRDKVILAEVGFIFICLSISIILTIIADKKTLLLFFWLIIYLASIKIRNDLEWKII